MIGPSPRVRVLVVDDDDLMTRALAALLESDPTIEYVGRARTGEEALELTASLAPDVVVMDVEMPGIGGLEATRRLSRSGSNAAVLVITGADVEGHVQSARESGALGYLPKADLAELLLPTIRAVARARQGTSRAG
jgi:DNA-binding NarL/FixJ family response regulator